MSGLLQPGISVLISWNHILKNMLDSPFSKGRKDRAEGPAFFRQAVFHLGGDFRIDLTVYQTVFFQFSQLFGEHPLGDIPHAAFEFVKTKRSVFKQMVKSYALPFASDNVKGRFYGATRRFRSFTVRINFMSHSILPVPLLRISYYLIRWMVLSNTTLSCGDCISRITLITSRFTALCIILSVMRTDWIILSLGFGVLIAAVGLLFVAGSIESLQSHSLIGIIKLIMFAAFLYELFRDGKELYAKAPGHHYYLHKSSLHDILAVNAGAFAAFFISIELGHGGVIASAITGMTAAVLLPGYAAAVYCGSFVGMASTTVFSSYTSLLSASFLSSLIYVAARPAFSGFGGKLGTIAFSGTLISLLLHDGDLMAGYIPEKGFGLALVFFSVIGALISYIVNVVLKHGPVTASALTGLLAGLVLPVLLGPEEGRTIALMVFAASFAGMSSRERVPGIFHILIAGALAGLLFIYTMPYAGGAGGKMGTIAFGAVTAVAGADRFLILLKKRF